MRRGGGAVRTTWAAITCVTVAVAVAVVAAPAGAAPAWSVASPAPGTVYGSFAAVSCSGPSSCFAVGIVDAAGRVGRLVERWNGSRWSVVPNPNPPGAVTAQLLAVSCAAANSCWAVGQYDTPVSTKALAERWDGTKWTIVPSPNPPAASVTGLSDVRCTTGGVCFAVGDWFAGSPDSSAESTLVERWDGTKWTIVPSPNRSFANDSGLSGVACWSASGCLAVGHYTTDIVTATLVEQWNGTAWSVVSSPNASDRNNELSAIACTSASQCFAVGTGHGTLAERWNGSGWSILTTPNPAGANGAAFTSVSCPSPSRCVAVGDSFKSAEPVRLVETWNGARWSITRTPVPPGTIRSALNGVSCATTTSCFAVGEYRLGPSRRLLLEHYG